MPTPLSPIDLSTATVGSSGSISLANCAPTATPAFTKSLATLQLYNESGVGLRLTGHDTGLATDLPAGAWKNVPIEPGETAIQYVVQYILPNAPVNTLLATYYAVGEETGQVLALGNSPVNVGNQTLTAQQVINDTNAAGFTLIESTVLGVLGSSVKITNDGQVTITPLVGGVLGQIAFRIDTSGVSHFGPGDVTQINNGQVKSTLALGGFTQAYFVIAPPDGKRYQFSETSSQNLQIFDVTDSRTLMTLGGTIQFDNNTWNTDGAGTVNVVEIKEIAGTQESGHYFTQFVAPSAVVWSYWITFRMRMTNVPSSITISGSTLVNCTIGTSGITATGFRLNITPTGAGTTSADFDWVTVGN